MRGPSGPNPLRRAWSASLLVALGWAAAGCGGDASDAVDLPAAEALPRLVATEDFRIGSLDDPDTGFTAIGTIRWTPSGTLFLSETNERQIRAYDESGRLVRTYGRRGDGPGEFSSIFNFGLHGDTLWVSDGSLRRLTLFRASTGELLTTVSGMVQVGVGVSAGMLPGGSQRTVTIFPNELDAEGRFVGRPTSSLMPNLPDSIVPLPRLLFDATGAVVDTLELVPTRVGFEAIMVTFSRGTGSGQVTSGVRVEAPAYDSASWRLPFAGDSATVRWRLAGTPPTGEVTLTGVSRDGDTPLDRGIVSYAPRPFDPRVLDSIADARPRGLQLSPRDSAELARVARSAMHRPPHHPPLSGWAAADDGGLRLRLDQTDPEVARWIVIDPDASVRGLLDLDARFQPRLWRADELWAVDRDEYGVPWLVRLRVESAGGGP